MRLKCVSLAGGTYVPSSEPVIDCVTDVLVLSAACQPSMYEYSFTLTHVCCNYAADLERSGALCGVCVTFAAPKTLGTAPLCNQARNQALPCC